MKKERFSKRSTSALPLVGRDESRSDRGGGVGAKPNKVAPTPPSPTLPHKGGESSAAFPSPDLVLLGEFGRAHGLKGEVRLKTYTGDPLAIADYGPLLASKNRTFKLKDVRPAPGPAADMLIARVEGVSTREAAEALNRVELYIARDKLPPPEDDDEFLLADLIGLAVYDEADKHIGTVTDIPNYGGGDILEIEPVSKGATALLPFTKAFVPLVDMAQKRIVIAAPDDLFTIAKPQTDEDEA